MSTDQNPPRKRGCFFYGCISLIILSLVVVVVGYLGFRHLANSLKDQYTDSKPALIESVEVTPAEFEALQKRLAAFKEALDSQKVSQELVLSAQDINALISKEPNLKGLKNKLFVMIDTNRIQGKVSWPLDNMGPLSMKGRYLNGTATFKASLENGILLVTLDGLEVNGKPLPPQLLAQFQKQNLAQDVQRDANTAQILQKFESLQIKDGTVVLKNKAKP